MAQAYTTDHRRGTLLAFVGVLVLSFDALLIRLADTGSAEVMFWRGLFMALSLTVALRLLRGRWTWNAVRAGGPLALMLVVSMGVMQGLFVLAIMNTTVANAIVILSVAPLFAGAFSGLFLGEWVSPRTWIAIAISIVGIAIVFGGSIGGIHWLGDVLALIGAFVVGANFTLLRRLPGVSRLGLIGGGGLMLCLLAMPFAAPFELSLRSLAVLAVMGLLQMPLSTVMMAEATRYLPSAEVTIFLALEAIFGTFWVWAFIGEQPPGLTLLGGALVLGTLAVHSWVGIRRQRVI